MDALLPEDVLAEVLGRLSPRSLAALRCVCKGLRDIVDDRRLLRADLLPHSLGGIFINFNALEVSEFFYPLVGPAANSGNLTSRVDDHCNGLVLLDDGCVVNPATRQWARLPPLPTLRANQMRAAFYKAGVRYLAFDPSVAPHYEVFLIPHIPHKTELGPVSEGYDVYMGIKKFIEGSFPFTPCWMGELSEKGLT
ncbi:putative F-box protein At3g16210 [Brachypodium distachyon]|uniref:putative F-box protein At3g16210 n=1 Tax=Brachypodium distachyon TaxID=15368 RepID=UPI000234ED6C|nr:putative F-box protein At3g16210 [Brachypodium distachyon]|eukprot:XP_024310439.1 putative F-box protein At3g16210 [Brachypodium distachyon]